MKVKDIAAALEEIVPLRLAQARDNVGLLIGDPQQNVKNILLTIDVTSDVLTEAKRLKTNLIVSYHPVIWDSLSRITADDQNSVVYDLVRCGIAVFSVHTALDSAVGGVNDGLAEIIGICDAKPIGDYVDSPEGDTYKLSVFIPMKSVKSVSKALFAAGAGVIGDYSHCGFGTKGEGSFLPLKGAKPAIGKKGKLVRVQEVRFETIVPPRKLDVCIAAMKKAHPYEAPAFDIFKLHTKRDKFGLGRIGELTKPMRTEQIVERVKRYTGAKAFGVVGDEKRLVKTAAVCAGSCGDLINSVISAKVDLFLTGELKHHQALAAQEANLTCICLSHSVSERFILKKFAKQLQKKLKDVTIEISKKDADPFRWKGI